MKENPYGAKRFRRAFFHFVGGRAVQAGSRALLVLLLVRILPIADYGAYMLLVGLAEMLLQVASFGILPVGHRYLPQLLTTVSARQLYRFVGTLALLQATALGLIVWLLWQVWPSFAEFVGFSPEQTAAARPAVWLFLAIPAFRFSADLQECLLEQGRAQMARALMPALRAFTISGLLLTGLTVDLTTVIIVDVGVTTVCLLFSWSLLQASLRRLHSGHAEGVIPVREILKFGWHMAAVDLLSSAAQPGAMRLALASALGVVESGLFAFLQSLERLVSRYLPGTLLRNIVRPVLVSRSQGPMGQSVVENGSALLMKSNLIVIMCGVIVIAIAGNEIVSIASDGKFAGAGFTLLLMFIGLSITAQRSVIEMVMQITGHTTTLRKTAFIPLFALLGVWFFAHHGLNFAIMIVVLGSLLSNTVALTVLKRSPQGMTFDWRGGVAIFVPAAIAAAIGFALRPFVPALPLAALMAALFLGALSLTKPLRSTEVALMNRGFGKRIGRFTQVLCRDARSVS